MLTPSPTNTLGKMDQRTAKQTRRVRPIQRKQRPKTAAAATTSKDPLLSNGSTNAHIQASSRNIIASNFIGNLDSNTMLARLGLDEAQNYIELNSSDCFIQEIDDLLYCALCFKKFSTPIENNQRNLQFPRVSKADSGQRNALFPRLQTQDNRDQGNSRPIKHSTEEHEEAYRQLISKLRFTPPGLETFNMMTLQHLAARWLSENQFTHTQVSSRLLAIDEFSTILNEVDPQCQFRIIGSFATGITLKDSDVNLELLHPNNKLFERDPRAKNSIHHKLVDPDSEYGEQINNHTMHYDLIANAVDTLYRIAKRIETNYLSVRSFRLVRNDFCKELSSKTPKLALIHEPTQTRVEILCYTDTRYRMDNLIRNYILLDERVLQLAILVKHWAKICRISNPDDGTFSPETLMVLVINFLQKTQPPVVPCLHEQLNKNEDQLRKRGPSTCESTDNDLVEDNDKTPKQSESAIDNIDIDDADNEIDEEPDDEIILGDFDQEAILSLGWTSRNTDPIHKLFIDFLKFNSNEFSQFGTVISILTLKKVTINDKKWKTLSKSVENPIKPGNNLAKSISSMRTFEYIKQCFTNGYFYLSSVPMTENLKPRFKPLPHPNQYAKPFFNLDRYESYLQMTKQRFDNGKKRNLLDEMIQQKLFARDVSVIQKLVEYCIEHRSNIETLANTVSRHYDPRLIRPPDVGSTTFCWLCRRFGHTKLDCPKRKRKSINLSLLDLYIDSINFDAEFMEIYEEDMISAEQSNRHSAIVEELEESIRTGTGLDCVLRLFGSTVNSLGSVDSDMDICMTLSDKPNGRDVNCIKILKKTFVALSKNEHISNIEPILAARVPIIKFKYDEYAVDLSMYNECAIHNSRLLRTYVSIDARVAHLCYIVKRYAKGCGIADASRGSLSSYAWNLLVIHFLQRTQPPILPVLQATLDPKQVFGVNGWNVWFEENIEANTMMPNELGLTSLFKEFLLYYSEFDFDQYVVSIRTNRAMTKFQKNWTHCMVAIEDPFELTYNLAGGIQDRMALYILESFPKTYEYIYNFQKTVRRLANKPTAEDLRKLFHGPSIMESDPPIRGCRHCGKIGHRVKDCPGKVFRSSG